MNYELTRTGDTVYVEPGKSRRSWPQAAIDVIAADVAETFTSPTGSWTPSTDEMPDGEVILFFVPAAPVEPNKGGRPKLDPGKKRRSHTGWYTDEEWRLLREYLAKLRAAEK